jgi:hypothetical protein
VIRDEAERLRSQHEVQKRTRFMLATGPLMVLVVVGVVYLGSRFWQRRRSAKLS